MTSLFRKIRKKLLADNKVLAYFRYALGEILLVVIGILIALQVNNWNEKQRTQQKISEVKTTLEAELRRNIQIANGLAEIGNKLSTVVRDITENGSLKGITYGNNTIYGEVFGVFDTFTRTFNNENLDHFIAYEKDLQPEDIALVPLSKRIRSTIEKRALWESKATGLSLDRIKEFSEELPWFYATDKASVAAKEEYISSSPYFKNKVIHYVKFQLNENIYYSTVIRGMSLILLHRLQLTNGESDITSILTENGLKPFRKIACDSLAQAQHEFLGFRNAFIAYNNSSETVLLRLFDEHHVVQREIAIPPRLFASIELAGMEYIQQGDACTNLYLPVRNGFLLFEN